MSPHAEIVDEQPSVDLVPMTMTTTRFHTSDPKVALQRMAEIAKEIVSVIESQKLYARISGKKYVTCPGWKTVGGMYGLCPYTVWTRPNESGQIGALLRSLQACEPDVDWPAEAKEIAGVEGKKLTRGGAVGLIRQLEQRLAELTSEGDE